MEEGLELFTEKHPQKAVKHLLEHVRLTILRDALKGDILENPRIEEDLTMFFESGEKHTRYLAPLLNFRKRRRESSSPEKETAEQKDKESGCSKDSSKKKGKRKAKNAPSGGHSSSKEGNSGGQNPNRNRSKKKKGTIDVSSMECYNCGKIGHGSWKCPK